MTAKELLKRAKKIRLIATENQTQKYFKKRIRGNYCEGCKKLFKEGEIIFTPQETEKPFESGESVTRYFCDRGCCNDFIDKRNKSKKNN